MRTVLRRLLPAAALALGVAGASLTPVLVAPAHAAVPKVRGIAVVDMQKVLTETKQGQAARKKLEESSKAKQDKLDAKRKKLESDQAKLKNLSGEKLAAAEEGLQKDYLEMQQIYMTMQQELAQQEGRVLEDIYKNCQTIIDKIATEMELDLVLLRDESTVLFVQTGLDITTELVKRYNAKYPTQMLTHGIANRDLGLTRMVRIRLYRPPLEEQLRFSRRAAAVDELKATHVTVIHKADALFACLQHRAFGGDLKQGLGEVPEETRGVGL